MHRSFAVIAMALLLATASGCQLSRSATNSPSITAESTMPLAMKGYELYSWTKAGDWYFSLLEGTNRLKTRQEVTAETAAVKGIEAIQRSLARLSKGEQVFWTIRDIPGMALPPESTVNQIKEFCAKQGIELVVVE